MSAKRQRTSEEDNDNHVNGNGHSNGHGNGHVNGDSFIAAEDVNEDPERVKFA